jgi:tetratricopeptide (TPR) repeat protein
MNPARRRLLWLLVALEAAVVGWLAIPPPVRTEPVLPDAFPDDPVLEAELRERAAAARTGDPLAWRRLGEALLSQGLYRQAEPAYREAARLDPRDIEAAFGWAFTVDRTGRMEESIPLYRRCLELPESPRLAVKPFAVLAIGRNLLREEQTTEAVSVLGEIAGFAPADLLRARALFRAGRLDDALDICDRALAGIPYSLEFHRLRGQILESLGRADEAFEAFRQEERGAHLVNPHFSTDYLRPFTLTHGLEGALAEIRRLPLDRSEEIHAVLRTLEERIGDRPIPQRLELLRLRSDLAAARGDVEGAWLLFEQIESFGDRNPALLEAKARLLDRLGRDEEARSLRLATLEMAPSSGLHRRVSEDFRRLGDESAARRHEARATFFDAIAAFRRNRPRDAATLLERSAELDGDDPRTWYHLGQMRLALGETQEAEKAFRKARGLDPFYGRARRQLDALEGSPESEDQALSENDGRSSAWSS